MKKKLTSTRLVMAIIGQAWQQAALFLIWKFLLPAFDISLHFGILLGVMLGWLIFGVALYIAGSRALNRQNVVRTTMVGSTGTTIRELSPDGMVRIHGELWGAVSEEGDIAAGEEIVVTGEQGLKLRVRKTK